MRIPVQKSTYGEQLLQNLLHALPTDEFYGYAEPRIDHSVKTSRYPDFVLVWRSKGVICLEVKDWKKIRAEDRRTIYVTEGTGHERVEDNPYETARDFTFQLKEKLLERRELMDETTGRKRLQFPIEPLIVLTHQSKDVVNGMIESGVFRYGHVLCAEDLFDVDTLKRALSRLPWTFPLNNPLKDSVVVAIQRTLSILEIRAQPVVTDEKGKKHGMLIEEQERIVWAPIPYLERGHRAVLVRGVVGSGKTIVLSKKVNLLSDLRPDLRILITAFNMDLAKYLLSQIDPSPQVEFFQFFDLVKNILGKDYPQYWHYRGRKDPRSVKSWCEEHFDDLSCTLQLPIDFVAQEISRRKELELNTNEQYLHDLKSRCADLIPDEIDEICGAYDLYIEYQQYLKESGEEYMDYEDTTKLAVRHLISPKNPFRQKYDVIMVDEAQDFSKVMFNLLRSMLRPGGYLFVCDDPLQTLWRDYNIVDRSLQNAHRYYLNLPLRTTREIAEAAQSLFEIVPDIRSEDDDEIYPAQTEHLQSGKMPELIQYLTIKEEEQQLISKLETQISKGVNPGRLAVLTPLFANELRAKVEELGVYYGHFNWMKGLEFDVVYIAKLDELVQSQWNKRAIMRRMLYRKLFVAMTRARRELYLSHTEPLPEHIEPLANFFNIVSKT
jgi:hypothetical protein